MPRHPELIIFDCDGVLIDSEIIANRVYPQVLAAFGLPITAADIDRFTGMTDAATFATLEREFGCTLPRDHAERLAAALKDAYTRDLQAIPGIVDVLAGLSMPCCVASSSTPDKLQFGLECVGLYERFAPNIFSAALVARGKPAPDLFLYAAEKMKVRPEACLVIEDSVNGVRAARAAGMTVLGFCGGGHCGPDHGARLLAESAAHVFDDMHELPRLLARN